MSQVHALYRLQQLETDIRQKKQQLGDILKAQKGSASLHAAREAVVAATAVWEGLQQAQRQLNADLKSLTSKSKESEDRLYSGKVKNPKELSDLQLEVASLGRRRQELENDILEKMIAIEAAEAVLSPAQERLDVAEVDWIDTAHQLKKDEQQLALRVNELIRFRKEQLAMIEPKLLHTYQELSKRKGGVAIVELKQSRCAGCGVTVTGNVLQSTIKGELAYCGSCGRILCLN